MAKSVVVFCHSPHNIHDIYFCMNSIFVSRFLVKAFGVFWSLKSTYDWMARYLCNLKFLLCSKHVFLFFSGWNFHVEVNSKMKRCLEWSLTFYCTLGRRFTCVLKFNGWNCIDLKLKDFDDSFFGLTSFLKFLMSSFELGFCLESIWLLFWDRLLPWVGPAIALSRATSRSWLGYCFEPGCCLESSYQRCIL